MDDVTERITEVLRPMVQQDMRLPGDLYAERRARQMAERVAAALPKLTPFWAIADGEGGQFDECYEDRYMAEEALADCIDSGYGKAHLITANFTGWAAVEDKP